MSGRGSGTKSSQRAESRQGSSARRFIAGGLTPLAGTRKLNAVYICAADAVGVHEEVGAMTDQVSVFACRCAVTHTPMDLP